MKLLLYVRLIRLLPAYIDPGAGSMVIQMIIAAAVALPVMFRDRIGQMWHRIRGGGRDAAARDAGAESSPPDATVSADTAGTGSRDDHRAV